MSGIVSLTFTINVTLERSGGGLFESKASLGEAIQEALESADPGSVSGDNGTSYDVTDWEVTEE